MTCVYTEYEGKIKMVFIGLLHGNFYLVGRELTFNGEEILPGVG